MRAIIGTKLLGSALAQPRAKPFEIYDPRLPGFTLRIQPSSIRSYYARLGRNCRIALGKVGELSPEEARERCQKVLGNVAHGRPPRLGLDGFNGPTLGQFIKGAYTRWARANRPRTATNTRKLVSGSALCDHARPRRSVEAAATTFGTYGQHCLTRFVHALERTHACREVRRAARKSDTAHGSA